MPFPAKALILGITLFAATNIDDTFVLLGFFADPKYRAHRVVIGQYLGIATLVAISLLAALIALIIPPALSAFSGFYRSRSAPESSSISGAGGTEGRKNWNATRRALRAARCLPSPR